MQTANNGILARTASAALKSGMLGLVLVASLSTTSQAAERKPAAVAVSKVRPANDDLLAEGRRLASRAKSATTQAIGRPLMHPMNYAMPSIPRPAQSLVPETARRTPMTTMQYAATLRAPLGNLRVSSNYGMRMHPLAMRELFHHGIDYAAPAGTPIRAAQDGQILEMRGSKGYGFVARMQHGYGVETVYGHMLKFMPGLKKGSVVRRGDIIGFVGSTGRSTGPHLHFEVIANGKQVNPMQLTIAFASDRLLSMR